MALARPWALIALLSPEQACRPTALALGSFDGVHAGHRHVIARAVAMAAGPPALVPTVLSFWPHPREVLAGEPRLRLDLPNEKLSVLGPLGIEQLVLVPFDLQLAALTPEQFVQQVLRDQLQAYIDNGDYPSALAVLQQAINEEPNNQAFRVELADVLILQGEVDEARKALATIPADTPELERPTTRLEMQEEAAGMGAIGELASQHEGDPDDLEIRYQLAVLGAVEKQYEFALDHCLAILQADREFRDDIGRTTMIRIFALMGKGSELATRYRRRMFALMH